MPVRPVFEFEVYSGGSKNPSTVTKSTKVAAKSFNRIKKLDPRRAEFRLIHLRSRLSVKTTDAEVVNRLLRFATKVGLHRND